MDSIRLVITNKRRLGFRFFIPEKCMPNYSQISSNCSQIYKFTNRRTEREQRRTDTREHISSSSSRKGIESRGRRHTGTAAPAPGTPTLGTPAGDAPPASAPGQRRQPTRRGRPHRGDGGNLGRRQMSDKGALARPSRGAALG